MEIKGKITNELSNNKKILQNDIKNLIESFVMKNGHCDINIYVTNIYMENIADKEFIKSDVDITISI